MRRNSWDDSEVRSGSRQERCGCAVNPNGTSFSVVGAINQKGHCTSCQRFPCPYGRCVCPRQGRALNQKKLNILQDCFVQSAKIAEQGRLGVVTWMLDVVKYWFLMFSKFEMWSLWNKSLGNTWFVSRYKWTLMSSPRVFEYCFQINFFVRFQRERKQRRKRLDGQGSPAGSNSILKTVLWHFMTQTIVFTRIGKNTEIIQMLRCINST